MKTIFAACTMQGEAHEQLHTYLLPMVKKFRNLEEAEKESDALILKDEILNDLKNYTNFFETAE